MGKKLKAFFDRQRSTGGGYGDRISFFPKPKKGQPAIDIIGRLFFSIDNDDDLIPAFVYKQHGFGQNSVVCGKWEDDNAPCDECDQSVFYYKQGNKDKGRELLAKRKYWFLFVPRMAGFEEVPHILEVPYGGTQKIWAALARKGGWSPTDLNLELEECYLCLEEGVEKCYGERGYDITIHYDPNAADRRKVWTGERFSDRPAKKIEETWETPNLADVFRRVKRLDDTGPQNVEPTAPPPVFDDMTKKEMLEYAESMGYEEVKKSWKVAKIREFLKSEAE